MAKQESETKSDKMGGVLGMFYGNGNDDTPDEATGLTPRQKKAMRDTWSLVEQNLKGNGVDFFLAFFEAHPTYKEYFKDFKGRPLDELRDCPKMRAHGSAVMNNLSAVVQNLDDPECLVEVVKKIANSHHPRGIRIEHYENLAIVFSDFMASKLGDKYDSFARDAWESALKVVNTVMKGRMEELAEEK